MMQKISKLEEPAKILGFPDDWQDQIKAHLASELEAGATLYGFRSDGAYIARTKDGDQVLSHPDLKSD